MRQHARHPRRLATIVASVGLLSAACTGDLLETKLPVPTVYILKAAPPPATAPTAPLPVDLAISEATATPGLDTERIAVIHEARRMDYYLDAQWGAALPHVVQALVVTSLQNQNWFRSVVTEQARINTNYWLELEVRDFQAEYASEGTAPTVRVTLVGSLVRIKDRKLIGVAPATITTQATDNRLGAVIDAFDTAAQQATLSMGKQVVDLLKGETAN